MFLRNSAKQSRSRAPPAASGGVRHVAGGWGKSTPSHQPGALGSFLGVKAKPLRGRCASLDPHPSDSAPQAPARASGAFSSGGRVKGLVRPAAPQGARTRPLDATGATQACRQGVGGALPPAPLPLGEGPGRVSPEGAVWACGAGGTPAWGSKGRAALGPCTANKNPLPKASISALRASLFGSSRPPEGGLNPERQKGNPGKPRIAGF